MAIHFYGTKNKYGCFSNFSAHPVEIDGIVWPTTEHYFQGMKFPHNPERQEIIRQAKSPGQSKRAAWVKGLPIRKNWDNIRDEIMLVALRAKFSQHADIRETLLSTGDEKLVEHTRRDSYWGDGGDGSGKNKLGKLLMKVRQEIRDGLLPPKY